VSSQGRPQRVNAGRKRSFSEVEGGGGGGRVGGGRWKVDMGGEDIEVKKDMIIFFLYKKGGGRYEIGSGIIDEVNGSSITVCCKEEDGGINNWNGRYMFCSTKTTRSSRVNNITQDEALKTQMEERQKQLNP
jgi:hypothetical protein